MGVPHFALKDVVIEGYTIAKGATVMASLYHSMRDPNVFKNPEIFDPARFIDAGNFFNGLAIQVRLLKQVYSQFCDNLQAENLFPKKG